MWGNNAGFGQDFDGGDAAGGGFMNTTLDSPGPGAGKKERRDDIVIPMPISSILNNSKDPFTYLDKEVAVVTIVGFVRSVEITSTKKSYVLDDHTGSIEVVKYSNSDTSEEQPGPADSLSEGMYAKVAGSVRSHQGKKRIMSIDISPLTDPNALTSHLLQVVFAYKKLKQLSSGALSSGPSTVLPNSSIIAHPAGGTSGSSLGSKEKDLVYNTIKSSVSESGMSRNMIKSMLEGKLTPNVIEKIVEDLASDGMIYTTHDDDHFQVIES